MQSSGLKNVRSRFRRKSLCKTQCLLPLAPAHARSGGRESEWGREMLNVQCVMGYYRLQVFWERIYQCENEAEWFMSRFSLGAHLSAFVNQFKQNEIFFSVQLILSFERIPESFFLICFFSRHVHHGTELIRNALRQLGLCLHVFPYHFFPFRSSLSFL